MKNAISIVFILFLLSLPIFGQINDRVDINNRQIPYNEVNVAFVLEGTPTLEDVGFDNPESFWKFKYELRFLNDGNIYSELQRKIYAKYENQGERTKWLPKANREIDKEIKEMSNLVTRGKIRKSSLLSKDNREILIPIRLTRQIWEIIAASAGSNRNPEFTIDVKGSVSTKTTSKLRFKKKYSIEFPCPVKIQFSDGKSYWSLNRCGVSIETVNENDEIQFGLFSRL